MLTLEGIIINYRQVCNLLVCRNTNLNKTFIRCISSSDFQYLIQLQTPASTRKTIVITSSIYGCQIYGYTVYNGMYNFVRCKFLNIINVSMKATTVKLAYSGHPTKKTCLCPNSACMIEFYDIKTTAFWPRGIDRFHCTSTCLQTYKQL